MSSLVRLQGVSFSHSSRPLFRLLDLQIAMHRRIALVGRNGSGKSTLLRLIHGDVEPEQGTVLRMGSVALLDQHGTVEGLSGGEGRLRAIEGILRSGADLVLLDEPTNDLDEAAGRQVGDLMRRFEGALLVVSHDPRILDTVDEIWELSQGTLHCHPPGFDRFVEEKRRQRRRNEERITELERETRKARQRATVQLQRQRVRMSHASKRAHRTGLSRIEKSEKRRQAQTTLGRVRQVQDGKVEARRAELADARDRFEDLSLFRWDHGSNGRFAGLACEVRDAGPDGGMRFSFTVADRQRLWLRGRNGSGKSTLLRSLSGDPEAAARLRGKAQCHVRPWLFDQTLEQFRSEES